jgi:hypothetical protein
LDWKARTALTSLGKLPPSEAESTPADKQKPTNHAHDLAPLLCYACLTAMLPSSTGVIGGAVHSSSEAAQGVRLPFWVSDRVSARLGLDQINSIEEDHRHSEATGGREMSMQEMRAAVDEFLIDDDEE